MKSWVFILVAAMACSAPKQSEEPSEVSDPSPTLPNPKMWNLLTTSMKQFTVKLIYITPDSCFIEAQSQGFTAQDYNEVIGGVDPIIRAATGDLDANGFEEFYFITQSTDTMSQGHVIAFHSNEDKSLSQIYFPELSEDLSAFYAGQDEIQIAEDRVVRTFLRRTGGYHRLTYKLVAGEASMQLMIEQAEIITD